MARVARTTLFESVVSEVKAKILRGEWLPGARIPGEQDLMQEFGVSRTPLREALKALHAMGILTIEHGKGIFVNDLPTDFQRQKDFLTLKDGISALHVLEVRRLLEIDSVKQVAKRADESMVAQIAVALENMEANRHDPGRFREADLAFHLQLAQLSGNPLISHIMTLIQDFFAEQMERDSLIDESLNDHSEILRGIRERAPRKAEAAMETHLRRMYDYHLESRQQRPVSSL